jgi:hypothetical protein
MHLTFRYRATRFALNAGAILGAALAYVALCDALGWL